MSTTLTIDTAWVRDLSAHGAIVLGYLVRRSEECSDPENWFIATTDDFKAATGIQASTYLHWRKQFEAHGILEVRTQQPGPNCYRLHLNDTANTVGLSAELLA